MNTGVLVSHVDSAFVTEAEIGRLPAPKRLGPAHQPVPHQVLIAAIRAAASQRGFLVRHQQLALGRHGARLFGVLDLVTDAGFAPGDEHGLAIGFRNSTDESLAIKMVAGARVFVCDNLALSGDLIALQRRNTTGLDLPAAMTEAFGRYLVHATALNRQIGELKEHPLTDVKAKARILDLFAERVLPLRLFRLVARTYFNATDATPDCQPRTLWGLHNAATRAIKVLTPARRFTVSVNLGKAFGLGGAPEAS